VDFVTTFVIKILIEVIMFHIFHLHPTKFYHKQENNTRKEEVVIALYVSCN